MKFLATLDDRVAVDAPSVYAGDAPILRQKIPRLQVGPQDLRHHRGYQEPAHAKCCLISRGFAVTGRRTVVARLVACFFGKARG